MKKCERCGINGPTVILISIYVPNGILTLCDICLSAVNRKNPRLAELERQLEAFQEVLEPFALFANNLHKDWLPHQRIKSEMGHLRPTVADCKKAAVLLRDDSVAVLAATKQEKL